MKDVKIWKTNTGNQKESQKTAGCALLAEEHIIILSDLDSFFNY